MKHVFLPQWIEVCSPQTYILIHTCLESIMHMIQDANPSPPWGRAITWCLNLDQILLWISIKQSVPLLLVHCWWLWFLHAFTRLLLNTISGISLLIYGSYLTIYWMNERANCCSKAGNIWNILGIHKIRLQNSTHIEESMKRMNIVMWYFANFYCSFNCLLVRLFTLSYIFLSHPLFCSLLLIFHCAYKHHCSVATPNC